MRSSFVPKSQPKITEISALEVYYFKVNTKREFMYVLFARKQQLHLWYHNLYLNFYRTQLLLSAEVNLKISLKTTEKQLLKQILIKILEVCFILWMDFRLINIDNVLLLVSCNINKEAVTCLLAFGHGDDGSSCHGPII